MTLNGTWNEFDLKFNGQVDRIHKYRWARSSWGWMGWRNCNILGVQCSY